MRALLPAVLAQSCEVANGDDGMLRVSVPSAAAAAKLRQTLPRLRDGLVERGWQVSGIRVRVQPRPAAAPEPRRRAPEMPAAAVSAFETLAPALQPSPLKDAVERLLRHSLPRRDRVGEGEIDVVGPHPPGGEEAETVKRPAARSRDRT